MARRKIPLRAVLLTALAALFVLVLLDLSGPDSYVRTLLDPDRSMVSPRQRVDRLMDRVLGPRSPAVPRRSR